MTRPATPAGSPTVRLVGGSSPRVGRLEVWGCGWGTVCPSSSLDSYDARVACKQMGYSDYSGYGNSYSNIYGTGPIWPLSFSCTGNEAVLEQCSNSTSSSSCYHSSYYDVGLSCSGSGSGYSTSSTGKPSLVGGPLPCCTFHCVQA